VDTEKSKKKGASKGIWQEKYRIKREAGLKTRQSSGKKKLGSRNKESWTNWI